MSQLATISALCFASKLCERPDSWDFVSVLYTWEGKMSSVQKLVLVLNCVSSTGQSSLFNLHLAVCSNCPLKMAITHLILLIASDALMLHLCN